MVPGCSHCWIGARKTDLAVIDMTAPSVVVVLVHAYCVSLTIAKVKAAVRAMLFDGIEGVRAGIRIVHVVDHRTRKLCSNRPILPHREGWTSLNHS
jgi:hypothetical protein